MYNTLGLIFQSFFCTIKIGDKVKTKRINKIFIFFTVISLFMFIKDVKADSELDEYVTDYAPYISVETNGSNYTGLFTSVKPLEIILIVSPFIIASILITIALFSISKQMNRVANNVNRTLYGFNAHMLNGYKELDQSKASRIIDGIDVRKFNNKAYKIFYETKYSFTKFDLETLKQLVSDEIYNIYKMELDLLKEKEQREVFSNFELLSIKLIDLKEQEDNYFAKVCLNVKFYDYVENIITHNILKGSKSSKVDEIYMLTLISNKDSDNWKLLKEEKLGHK